METTDAVLSLAALAHEHRLAIYRVLVRTGPGGMPAGKLAHSAGCSASALSFHIKELERAGLVRSRRQGRFIYYSIEVEAMRRLLTFLTEDCCEGRPELCGGDVAGSAGFYCHANDEGGASDD